MKSTFRLFIAPFIGTSTLCLTLFLSGCGQPGPLYLPKPPAAKPAKSGAAPAAPVPAPIAPPSTTPVSPQ